ncbi:uncharacterized protein LOC127877002 isoform X2 [Dreissena polymorpha]|uniref:Uncharacterized protein n=1 Tax=Dreissena polymorpha TaxID=45954 RepID=A0A9D4KC59_DREPO|nr:uncharacterized protein LOC127877002 isoform X2 [Dreissena polymorpha]KAH3836576.1 hypothetical protein DPMN_109948 [Dreissena polymorpha]
MVNLLYTQTKDGFIIAIDTDRIQSAMASGEGDSMAPDEMYLMLQADMLSIKQQEQVLHSEIEDIASKFHELLESCGIDSDTGSGIMAPPSTPSFMKTNAHSSLTQVTRLETLTFMRQTPSRTTYSTYSGLSDSSSDDESRTMFPESEQILEGLVNKSDGLPQDVSSPSSKTLVVDRNSNYLDSPHSEANDNHTPVIEAIASLDKTSSSDSNTTTSSGSSNRMSSSSDGYPKSDESTDNQIVPECYDLDKEFMSRLQYYSDFTLDRQRKINSMVVNCGGALKDADNCEAAADILTRHVEGKESSPEKPMFVKPLVPPPSTTSSGSDYHSTPSSRRQNRDRAQRHRYSRSSRKPSSKPLASSTMLDSSFSSSSSGRGSHRGNTPLIPQASSTMIYESGGSSSGSNRRNKSNGSNPRACSTMLNESFLSTGSSGSGSRHRSTPMANSTMINALPAMVLCGAEPTISVIRPASDNNGHSDNDCESVYTWSIHDGDSGSDKDISLEESYMKKVTNSHKKANNKPPLPPSKRARSGSVSSRGSNGEPQCKDHQLHKLLGEPCSKTILASCSVIEPSDTCREEALFVESMCGDITECTVPKSNTLPRSSTRVKLQDKSSGSSSLEARRASLPDLTSVGATYTDDHSVPESFSDDDMIALSERPECQGKSSSSNDNPGGNSQGSANVDSILTDSPNSVCSSGINAPYNSPGTNTSSSSRVSLSTTSDARSSDSNINTRAPQVNLRPRISAPVNSPKLQNVDTAEGAQGSTFKVPKQNLPLRNLFRFRRKSKTPEVKTSTPKPVMNAQPGSKRQLFPSAGTANLQNEVKVMDKKAVIRKFKKFSDSFRQRDRSGKPQIETLANL